MTLDEGPSQNIAKGLLEILISTLASDRAPEGAAVAFSGGLDSTVLAAVLKGAHGESAAHLGPALVTVGTAGCKDMENARRAANALDLPLREVELGTKAVLEWAGKVVRAYGTMDPVVVPFTVPLFVVLCTDGPARVYVGHGGDELFGGYSRYLRTPTGGLQAELDADLAVLEERVAVDRVVAKDLGRDLVAPFLHPDFVEAARDLPPAMKVDGGERKVALRLMAKELGLPDDICMQSKTAAQYGSGVMKVLKKEARKGGHSGVEALLRHLGGG